MSWYNFSIYYSANVKDNNQKHKSFDAIVYDADTYRVIKDANKLFETQFIKIIKGKFSYSIFNEEKHKIWLQEGVDIPYEDFVYEKQRINEGDAIKNLDSYIKWMRSKGVSTMDNVSANLNRFAEFIYGGPDLGFGKGMNLNTSNKASKNVTKIYNFCDHFFNTGEQVTLQEAGSLVYAIDTVHDNVAAKIFLTKVLESLKVGRIDKNDFDDTEERALEPILKCFYEASCIRGLEWFTIKLGAQEIPVTLDSAYDLYKSIRKNAIEITGTPSRLGKGSFTIGQYACHLNKLNSEDAELYNIIVTKAFNDEETIRVSGITSPQHDCTITVESIEII